MELLKFMFRFAVRLIAVHVVVYSVAIFGPMLFVVPFILIRQNPTADYTWLALTLFWVAPISAGFYTNFYYHWASVKQWQREGGQRRCRWGFFIGIFPTVSYRFSSWEDVRMDVTEPRKSSSCAKHCIFLIPLAAGNGFKKIPLPAPVLSPYKPRT